MGVNVVTYGGKTLVDMRNATATADTVFKGYIAYGADGEPIVGTAESTRRVELQVTLPRSGWDLDNEQTVAVDGVSSAATVIVTGAEDSQPEYDDCAVRCTAQEDGTLTFACDVVPAENLVVNIAIFV